MTMRSPSRNIVLAIVGGLATEAGVYILWKVFGLIPSWVAISAFVILLIVWVLLYYKYKPKETNMVRGRENEKEDFGVEKLAKAQDELRKEDERRKKLNEKLFKPWKEVSISIGKPFYMRFDIDISPNLLDYSPSVGKNIGEPQALTYFEEGVDFLNQTSDYTRTIWLMWKDLEDLKSKYDSISEQIQKRMGEELKKAYPSLQRLEAPYTVNQDCYVIDSITQLIWFRLKDDFLKNGQVSWEGIVFEEKTEDTLGSFHLYGD